MRKILVFLFAIIFCGSNVMAGPSGNNSICTCPDGTSYKRNNPILFHDAALSDRLTPGTIVSIDGCGGATYRYFRYRLRDDFRARRIALTASTAEVCQDFKLLGHNPKAKAVVPQAVAANTAPSPDPDTKGDYTVGLPQPLHAAPIPASGPALLAGGFRVGEHVVAARNIKVSGHKVRRGTLGQIVGSAAAGGERLQIVFFTRPHGRIPLKVAAWVGIMGATGYGIYKGVHPATSIAGVMAAMIASEMIKPIKKISGDVDPLDLQGVLP